MGAIRDNVTALWSDTGTSPVIMTSNVCPRLWLVTLICCTRFRQSSKLRKSAAIHHFGESIWMLKSPKITLEKVGHAEVNISENVHIN